MVDALYLIWKSPESRKNYTVGKLTKNNDKYYFEYSDEFYVAKDNGFSVLIPFQDEKKVYESDNLFPVFENRLPDKKRKDIKEILDKYGMKEYDSFKLLKEGAELPVDNLKFVPALDTIEELDGFRFSVAGVRYYLKCGGKDCTKAALKKEMLPLNITLVQEKTNKQDKDAIVIIDNLNNKYGYVPRYYTKILNEAIEKSIIKDSKIVKFAGNNNCDNCLLIELSL